MTQNTRLEKFFASHNTAMPQAGIMLIIRANANPVYGNFDPLNLHCQQSFKPSYDALMRMGITPHQSLPASAQSAIVELTRSKPENLANIAKAYALLDMGANLYIDGAKTDGIESILKAIAQRTDVEESYSKSHGKMIWLIKNQQESPFADWVHLADIAKNKDAFYTAPGIFSSDAIDPASALLCENITHPLRGKGADLGAGWGYLSHHALQNYPAISDLDLFEAEHISLNCAQQNITDKRAQFHWQDVQTMAVKPLYDFILMNPPFHIARKAEPSIGRSFIERASKMLTAKGRLWLVANKQLAYEATLDTHFKTWSYVTQSSQYKVIYATRPK